MGLSGSPRESPRFLPWPWKRSVQALHSPSSHDDPRVFAVERLNFITHIFLAGLRGLQYCPAFQKWPRPRLLSLEPLKLGLPPCSGLCYLVFSLSSFPLCLSFNCFEKEH